MAILEAITRRLWQLRADNGSVQLDPAGDARGTDAVDLQANRTLSSQVASGARSVIVGGRDNVAAVDDSLVFGIENQATGVAVASLVGGFQNVCQASYSLCCGQANNIELGTILSGMTFGFGNRISAQRGAALGDRNWVNGIEGTCFGSNCKVDRYRGLAMGDHARAWEYGQFAWSNGPLYTESVATPDGGDDFNMVGTISTLYGWATAGNTVNLGTNGAKDGSVFFAGREMRVQPDYTQVWRMTIVGREKTSGQSAYWLLRTMASRNGSADVVLDEAVVLDSFNPASWPAPVVSVVAPDILRVSCSAVGSANPRHFFCTGPQIYVRYQESG